MTVPPIRIRIPGTSVFVTALDLVLAFAIVVLLSSCAPVSNFTAGAINEGLGDEAVLYLLPAGSTVPMECEGVIEVQGVCFVPVYEAQGVLLALSGEGLEVSGGAPCSEAAGGLSCAFGTVGSPVGVEVIQGSRVAASATYRREGSNVVRQEVAILPD